MIEARGGIRSDKRVGAEEELGVHEIVANGDFADVLPGESDLMVLHFEVK